jgi:DNA repair protein RadD
MVLLREYQQRTITDLYKWFSAGNAGNPCIVMPTGSGKSHIVAALCKDALQAWPETQILMLTHVKELIEQNAEKMRQHWPNAPMGIYSASMRIKRLGEPITFAGIQSIKNKAAQVGHIDLVIIDECHLVNHKEHGDYRTFLYELTLINPALRVIGLTATPFRMGHGYITDKPALFDALLTPVGIEELIYKGFLAPLRSKHTKEKLDTSGVKKRGGEFIESELQAAVDTDPKNRAIVAEVIERAGDRKAWLFFCAGVEHAHHVAMVLREKGITAACVTGDTPNKEREQILSDFKAGKLRALTNANVLTTGFDYPDIDLIAMLRPTMSPSLYVQMAGRGMRPKSHTDHCMVLDFAGVVATHGPITAVDPPKAPNGQGGNGDKEAPVKSCPKCYELVHPSVRICPSCNYEFPIKPPKLKLRDDDIMGLDGQKMNVTEWKWRKHLSRTSGKEMLAVSYYGDLSDPAVVEYFPVTHDGYAGEKALRTIFDMSRSAGINVVDLPTHTDLDEVSNILNTGASPHTIEYKKDGGFFKVTKRSWI